MKDRILIVEDSATQREALRTLLEGAGYDVTGAASGEEALQFAGGTTFDLVLTDIVMPGMSGYDLCRRIKDNSAWSGLPVVLLTSLGDPMDVVRGLECGADNYVTKPYEPGYLLTRVRNVLDRRRLRRDPRASVGVSVSFLGSSFTINSDREQILDLFISTVEDVVRANHALQESQRELAEAQRQLENYAHRMAVQAQVSADKYSALMHHASDAIFVLDGAGRVLDVNVRGTELLGLPPGEIVGRELEQFVEAGQRSQVRDQLEGVAGDGRRGATPVNFPHHSGRVSCCELSVSKTYNGREELALAIVHDVTAHRRALQDSRDRALQLSHAQQLGQMGSWEWDVRADRLSLSEELRSLLGAGETTIETHEEFLRRVHPDDRAALRTRVAKSLERRELLLTEYRVLLPNGDVRHMFARGEVETDDAGAATRMAGIARNVTEERAREEALRRSDEQLRQAQKMDAVGQLAGGIAHDFNNILTAIKSYSELLLDDLAADDARREDVAEISAAADRAAALTSQLLTFSRQQVMQPLVLALDEVVTDLHKLLRRVIRENITLVTHADASLWAVEADRGHIEQVVMNLVINARDAMPDGGEIGIRLTNAAFDAARARNEFGPGGQAGRYVLLEVEDTGIGMTVATQRRIFDPFFTTKPSGKGTGLGLSTVYGIVKQSGGYITVTSQPGRGSTFRIYLPATEAAVTISDDRRERRTERRRGSEAILLVEDDHAVRGVTKRILERSGYTVIAATDGPDALRLVDEHGSRFALVISDMMMPEMSGPELITQIRARSPEISVLFMSGYTEETMTRRGAMPARVEFIAKPFAPDALATKVRAVLDARTPAGKPAT